MKCRQSSCIVRTSTKGKICKVDFSRNHLLYFMNINTQKVIEDIHRAQTSLPVFLVKKYCLEFARYYRSIINMKCSSNYSNETLKTLIYTFPMLSLPCIRTRLVQQANCLVHFLPCPYSVPYNFDELKICESENRNHPFKSVYNIEVSTCFSSCLCPLFRLFHQKKNIVRPVRTLIRFFSLVKIKKKNSEKNPIDFPAVVLVQIEIYFQQAGV